MRKFFNYLFFNPCLLVAALWSYVGHIFSDEIYLSVRFRLLMGKWPNLNNPRTFSEKIQWLKLHDRNPRYSMMVDKLEVKKYVANIIGDEYVIPILGVWRRPEDIEWDALPNQFVLKTTHGGGSLGVVICKDKDKLNKKDAICKLKTSMKKSGYRIQGEWPYKNVPHRIIAEKYIEPQFGETDLPDYKFFCFNSDPIYCQVISGRESKMCIDFFDKDWNHLPFHEPKIYPFSDVMPKKPKNFEKMKYLAEKLSSGMKFSRIDFYEVGNRIFFGEITFYPTGGFGGFEPEKYDIIMGDLIRIED